MKVWDVGLRVFELVGSRVLAWVVLRLRGWDLPGEDSGFNSGCWGWVQGFGS